MKTHSIFHKRNALLAIIIVLLFSSCKIAYYPTSYNIPLMKEKGDLQLTGVVGLGNIELQSAYAVTDNVGVTINGSFFSETKELNLDTGPRDVTLSYNYLEGGVGYFTPLGGVFKYEIYGGAGTGMVPADLRNSSFDGTQRASRNKLFVQPAFGVSTNFADIAAVVRLAAVSVNNEANFFAEPGVVIKLGYKSVKFYANGGISYPYAESGTLSWDHNYFIIGFGLQVSLNRIKEN
jgi:hypothetical protein